MVLEKEVFVLNNWKSNYILGEAQVWGWEKEVEELVQEPEEV